MDDVVYISDEALILLAKNPEKCLAHTLTILLVELAKRRKMMREYQNSPSQLELLEQAFGPELTGLLETSSQADHEIRQSLHSLSKTLDRDFQNAPTS